MSKTNSRTKTVAFYATNKPGTFVEVSVHYSKGMNYFTYETYNGYKLSFNVVTLKDNFTSRSKMFTMFSGLGLKVEPAERFNAKRLAAIASLANTLPDFYAALNATATKNGVEITGENMTEAEAWASVTAATEAA